ncbi:hypothetical protein [Streptomyces purpurascens]|uniref:hypothetical protein n=1 Tax=Streptomyces purpurascens TaxID=1924 RepID=UPI001677B2E9|nr:hypothetical protein [Streptomyces purpurascens]GHA40515.1 hypothetical protein GCM10010303_59690 [Streptomyces purpurascens]
MTQSGQGEEPSARQAREGIVLPSDGGEPLLPGMTGGPGDTPAGRRPGPAPTGQAPASAPAGGQTWGQPWGPDQQTPPPPQDNSWQSPQPQQSQQWATPEPPAWDAQHAQHPAAPGALPQEGTQPPSPYAGYGTPPDASQLPPAPGSYGTPLPQTTDGYGSPAAGGLPPASDAYGSPAPGSGAYGAAPGVYGAPAGGAPLPPATDGYGSPSSSTGAGGAPLPAPADEGATQYLPPVAAAADEGATQYIPPVGPGALPPETPTGHDPEATTFLGTAPRAGAGPLPPASNPDAEATQYIAPVPGGDKQPPAEFDNLFRSDHGAESPAAATQQMPRFEQPQPQPHSSHGAPQPSYAPPGHSGGGHSRRGRSGRGGRTGSRVPVIAAVGIGIAVLGVGAGALLAAGGGGDDDGSDNNKTVAASAPATDDSASPSADPARAQAVELDKLLADSGDSRSTVINAVADVKGCDNLPQAAKNLRDAAKQRTGLVTRLSGITVDQLPDHAALTTALTKAWQASASADNHYAAWADQTAGKKGCKKGQARATGQTQAGNRASGVASTEKTKAAGLWNAIAKTYGLTERQPTQL